MHTEDKPEVDMTYCLGFIERMLKACKPKLPEKEYEKLRASVLSEESYIRQKEIISAHVKIVKR